MRKEIAYGRETLGLDIREAAWVELRGGAPAPPVADPAEAVRQALETPLGFPPLRRALTPDDHVAVLVDEGLPQLARLLTVVLEHVASAGVAAEAVTLLCPPSSSRQDWLVDLPERFEDVRVEVHDPEERKKLAYLATTRGGRRLYLNRTAVDADQLVVLSRRGYDAVSGYSGGVAALFPALSDAATRAASRGRPSAEVPGSEPWPLLREATEAAWLLGAPFLVQVIEGAGDEVIHVVAGPPESGGEAQTLLDARWRRRATRSADLVVAALGGDPARQDFADLARALAAAGRVVRAGGRVALLTGAAPLLGEGAQYLLRSEDPEAGLRLLEEHRPPDLTAAFQWAASTQQAKVYLLSGLGAETAEGLFAAPLEHARQVQRLVDTAESCLLLPDAHKTMAFAEP